MVNGHTAMDHQAGPFSTMDIVLSSGIKNARLAGRVKEGRKGLPLPATGDEKGAFTRLYSNPCANLLNSMTSN
jgi:hypothetical protein